MFAGGMEGDTIHTPRPFPRPAMNLVRIDPAAPEAAVLAGAAAILRAGGLVAFPTETVYGLGANALDPAAIARIYAAKGRPAYNPLIVHVPDAQRARALASDWTAHADALAEAFWPGPLTLVVPRAPHVPDAVTAGRPNVALRVPAHPVAHALLLAADVPVAAPSANRSTEISPSSAEHVAKSLGDRVDLILDGGPTPVGIESTVVSLLERVPVLLRPGTISLDQLRAVVGDVSTVQPRTAADEARLSPGMLDRHYAPRGRVVIAGAGELAAALAAAQQAGARPGGIVYSDAASGMLSRDTEVRRLPGDAAGYAAGLYAALHALDDAGCDPILVEGVPDDGAWAGVRDRLRRAAHAG
jgi:L-threonylcarbamoyladenylate synthase